MGKQEKKGVEKASKGKEVFNPSEQLEKLLNHYKSVENPAENILVTIQYLEGAKKEIDRDVLNLEVVADEVSVFNDKNSFELEKLSDALLVEFAKANNLILTSNVREEMLDEIEKQLKEANKEKTE